MRYVSILHPGDDAFGKYTFGGLSPGEIMENICLSLQGPLNTYMQYIGNGPSIFKPYGLRKGGATYFSGDW